MKDKKEDIQNGEQEKTDQKRSEQNEKLKLRQKEVRGRRDRSAGDLTQILHLVNFPSYYLC